MDTPDFFVDGPINLTVRGAIGTLTFTRYKTRFDAAILQKGGKPEAEIVVVCSLTMPTELLGQLAGMVAKKGLAEAPVAGSA